MKVCLISIYSLLLTAGCKTTEPPQPAAPVVYDDPAWVEPEGEFPVWAAPPEGWSEAEPNPNAPSTEEEVDPDWDTDNP